MTAGELLVSCLCLNRAQLRISAYFLCLCSSCMVPLSVKWCSNALYVAVGSAWRVFVSVLLKKKWSWCWIFRLTWMCQVPIWAVVPSNRTPRGEVRDKWICGCCTASMWKAPLINRHNTSRLHRFLFIFNVVFIEYLHTSMRPFSLIPYFFSVSAAWELLLLCKCRVWTGFIVWSSLSPLCATSRAVCVG